MATANAKRQPSPEGRFWANVDKGGECWRWTGATRSGGYGVVKVGGRNVAAHRQAWELRYGPLPAAEPDDSRPAEPWQVRHLCGNKRCVRPEHLQLVSPADAVVLRSAPRNARSAAQATRASGARAEPSAPTAQRPWGFPVRLSLQEQLSVARYHVAQSQEKLQRVLAGYHRLAPEMRLLAERRRAYTGAVERLVHHPALDLATVFSLMGTSTEPQGSESAPDAWLAGTGETRAR